jgi:ComF family protein
VLATATNSLVRVLLAPVCVACRLPLDRPLARAVCDACWSAIDPITEPLCARCGDVLDWRWTEPLCARCRRHPPEFTMARSAGRYDGPLRRLVHAFKYEGRRALAAPLGALMRRAGMDLLVDADAVVPVPLHPLRALQRGFNQADDLARQLGLPVLRALRRTRHGPPQAELPASRRQANVREAFAPRGLLFVPRARLPPLTVVLIDDVMTTGATANACASVLIGGGVRLVRVLTMARAVAGPPEPPP